MDLRLVGKGLETDTAFYAYSVSKDGDKGKVNLRLATYSHF